MGRAPIEALHVTTIQERETSQWTRPQEAPQVPNIRTDCNAGVTDDCCDGNVVAGEARDAWKVSKGRETGMQVKG